MKVFISWSGEESHAVAQALRAHLPYIINAVKPFVSSEDVEKGAAWFQNIGTELEKSEFGILCLTSTNQNSKWVQFEAGALAGRFSKARVAPLLINTTSTSIKPPLSQFQLTDLNNKEDFYKLLVSINAFLQENALPQETLRGSFENWWNPFTQQVRGALSKVPIKEVKEVERSEKDLLEEILGIVRSMRTPPIPSLLEELRQNKNHPKSALLDYLDYLQDPSASEAESVNSRVARKPLVALKTIPAIEVAGISRFTQGESSAPGL